MFSDFEFEFEAESFSTSMYLSSHSVIRLKEGENRFVIILVVNIKQLVLLSDEIDGEKVLFLSDQFIKGVIHKIHKYGGFVERRREYILAYFGIIRNTEHDAKRAILCALSIQKQFQKFKEEIDLPARLSFTIQQAIHTGEVVASKVNKNNEYDYSIWGINIEETVEISDKESNNQILLTENVKELVIGYIFESIQEQDALLNASLSLFSLKGAIKESSPSKNQLFLGRTKDINKLLTIYKEYKDNLSKMVDTCPSHFVWISAEKGMGKARLAKEFSKQIGQHQQPYYYLRGIAENVGNIPYALFSNMLRIYTGISSYDTVEQAKLKLENSMELLRFSHETDQLTEHIPVLGLLLGIRYENDERTLSTGEDLQLYIHLALKAFIETIAKLRRKENCPFIIGIENAHHIDEKSLHFLKSFVFKSNDTNGILFVITSTNYQPKFEIKETAYFNEITLLPLNKEETRELMSLLLGNSTIPETVLQQLQEQSMGNPYYIEEWVKLVKTRFAHQSISHSNEIRLPNGIKSILLSRIDTLSTGARILLQEASVIGSVFDIRILEKMSGRLAHAFEWHVSLQELISHSLIVPQDYNGITFKFYHVLIHDVAYDTLLGSNKKLLHAIVAQAIEDIFNNQLHHFYYELVKHYEHAQMHEKIIRYLQLAAEKARNEFANQQALVFYAKLLEKLDVQKDEQALKASVYLNMGALYRLLNEIKSAEIYLDKAQKIAVTLKSESLIAKILYIKAWTYLKKDMLEEAKNCLKTAIVLFTKQNDKTGLAKAYASLGSILIETDEIETGINYIKSQLHYIENHPATRLLSTTLLNLGYAYQQLGEISQALNIYTRCSIIARKNHDLNTMAIVLGNRGETYQQQQMYQEAILQYSMAIQEYQKMGLSTSIGVWQLRLAECYFQINQYANAILQANACIQHTNPHEQLHFSACMLVLKSEYALKFDNSLLYQLIGWLKENKNNKVKTALAHYTLWEIAQAFPLSFPATIDSGKQLEKALHIYRYLYQKAPRIDYRLKIENLERRKAA